jgi:hypothetical protein
LKTASIGQRTYACLAGLAFLAAGSAHAAPADDVFNQLANYYQQANNAKTLNDAYSTLRWAQPYVAASMNQDGTLNWSATTINDLTAQQVMAAALNGASTRCGSDRQQTTDAEVAQFTKVLGAKFNADQYKAAKSTFCQVVQVAAQLKMRYDAYQQFKQNGIKLAGRSASQGLDFAGRHRTVGVGFTLMYYPDLMDTAQNGFSAEDRFQYNSYIKWSDDNPTPLNIVKRIRESQDSDEGRICLPVISDWAFLCVRINSVSTSSVNMSTWAKVHRYNKSKSVSLGDMNVPAPFGYLDELAQMKDNAKQDLYNKVMAQLSNYLNINTQMLQTLQTAYTIANSAH